MSKERDALQRIIERDEAIVRAGSHTTGYQISNQDPLKILEWVHVCFHKFHNRFIQFYFGWK